MDAPTPPPTHLATRLRRGVPLAPATTLELGGPAAFFVHAEDDATVREALVWAREQAMPTFVMGGGSNLVVADAGFDGLVVRLAQRGVTVRREGDTVHLSAAAGEPWDALVAMSVSEGWAGLECLSGIPGTAGATPIQNVGAYGQEVSEAITAVRVLDRRTLAERMLAPQQCAWSYRDSVFRRDEGRFVILAVEFRLHAAGRPTVRYPELARALEQRQLRPGLDAVRNTVLELRRRKSMLLDPDDENRRSVGSFFVNPIVSAGEAHDAVVRAMATGVARGPGDVPRYDAAGGGVKLSAAWLVERAGFPPGTRRGRVRVSSRHALALVHDGAATTSDLLALAAEIRTAVRSRFGVTLVPEPTFLGFGPTDPLSEAGA